MPRIKRGIFVLMTYLVSLAVAFFWKLSAFTVKRVCVPLPIRPALSNTSTSKSSRLPSKAISLLLQTIPAPRGEADRWSTLTFSYQRR